MDLINILFVVDEYTDVEPAPAVKEIADMLIDAVYNPQRPGQAGELVLGKMMRE